MQLQKRGLDIYRKIAMDVGVENIIITGLFAIQLLTGYGKPNHIDVIIFAKSIKINHICACIAQMYEDVIYENGAFRSGGQNFFNVIMAPNPKPKQVHSLTSGYLQPFLAILLNKRAFIVLRPEILLSVYAHCIKMDTTLGFDMNLVNHLHKFIVNQKPTSKELNVDFWFSFFMKKKSFYK